MQTCLGRGVAGREEERVGIVLRGEDGLNNLLIGGKGAAVGGNPLEIDAEALLNGLISLPYGVGDDIADVVRAADVVADPVGAGGTLEIGHRAAEERGDGLAVEVQIGGELIHVVGTGVGIGRFLGRARFGGAGGHGRGGAGRIRRMSTQNSCRRT